MLKLKKKKVKYLPKTKQKNTYINVFFEIRKRGFYLKIYYDYIYNVWLMNFRFLGMFNFKVNLTDFINHIKLK